MDGWPLTKEQVDLLNKHRMIPVCIVELEVSDEECLRRGECDRKSPSRFRLHVFTCMLINDMYHNYLLLEKCFYKSISLNCCATCAVFFVLLVGCIHCMTVIVFN